MTTIKSTFAKGGAGLSTPDHEGVALVDTLRDIADDLLAIKGESAVANLNAGVADITSLRTKLIATLAKLDADATVNSTDYAATFTPAALTAAVITGASGAVALANALIVDITAWRTKFVLALAHLDADTGVTDTNYAALWTPAAITATAITTSAEVPSAVTKIAADLAAIRTAYAGALAKLDADAGVTDTNYASTAAIAALTIGVLATLLTIKG